MGIYLTFIYRFGAEYAPLGYGERDEREESMTAHEQQKVRATESLRSHHGTWSRGLGTGTGCIYMGEDGCNCKPTYFS